MPASLGRGASIASWTRYLRDPIDETERLAARYGPAVQIGPLALPRERPNYHLSGAAMAKLVFGAPEIFESGGMLVKGPKGSALNRLRQSFFAANGYEHAYYQKHFKHFFRRDALMRELETIARIADEETRAWPHGTVFDAAPKVERLTCRLASAAAFRDPDHATDIALRAAEAVSALGRLGAMSWRNLSPIPFPGSTYRATLKQAEETEKRLLDWAATRHEKWPERDLLSMIVHGYTEKYERASAARIVGYAWNMFGATYDTTTSILSWALLLMAQAPAEAAKVRGALEEAGWRPGADPELALNCRALEWFSNEALRLLPAAPFQRRKTAEPVDIAGLRAPRRSTVIVSAWATNRDPALYPEPDLFKPDRWDGLARSPYEWLTFSAGPRRCTGIWIAKAFIHLSLAHVLFRHNVTAPRGAEVDMRVKLTLRPHPAAPIRLEKPGARLAPAALAGAFGRRVRVGDP